MATQTVCKQDHIDSTFADYLLQQEQKDILRFITCGSVDDGKSTLIGRILHDTKMIFDDQLTALERDSKSVGTTGAKADLALLVDGLQSEREQGITIDVAYRYFTTERRKFIIADTPGHEQYTRNMATGASSAQLAILLVDARYGVQQQTRRHSYICALLGIKHFIVAVNKMDLVEYSQDVFENIRSDFQQFSNSLFESTESTPDIQFVPLSALAGDNVVWASKHMPWYSGDTLMSILETVEISADQNTDEVRLPVQYVNRPHLNFRGYCGTLASGTLSPGQSVKVLPSGKNSVVESVYSSDKEADCVYPGEAITVTLKDEIDISRGDLIVGIDEQVNIGSEFDAEIVWMHETALVPGRRYDFKIGTTYASGTVDTIHSQVNVNTLERSKTDTLELNGIGEARIQLTQDVVYDLYHQNNATGSFIIIDRLTNITVGAGMISRPDGAELIEDAANDELHHLAGSATGTVTPQMRAAIKPHAGKCIWVEQNGDALEYALHQRGLHTWLLKMDQYDSDTVAAVTQAMLEAGLVVVAEGPQAPVGNIRESQLIKLGSAEISDQLIERVLASCKV